ncbi:MAG: DUF1353 domain-containing protein [Phycisphaerae bacterium]|nr:DUF1353 domain-containing protein [Phycisphaerae bacterium]
MILYKKRSKYKYNLRSDTKYSTNLDVENPADLGFLAITSAGELTIRKGYSWDGPSGPTLDTKNFMRGSLVHDALYQLMREEILPQSARKRADEILRDICRECGMSKFRAWYVYQAVRLFAAYYAKPDLLQAP